MEEFYKTRNIGMKKKKLRKNFIDIIFMIILDNNEFDFPTEYPTSVLLGCIDVIDCLDRNSYLEQYPNGESDSEYVLICENPQELFFKLPMRGQHKICK